MLASAKKKWLKALRSRKYKQGTGELHCINEKTHCCLGVLCDISKQLVTENENGSFISLTNTFDWNQSRLPDTIKKSYNISRDEEDKLINMNDDGNHKFYHIARWIERNM